MSYLAVLAKGSGIKANREAMTIMPKPDGRFQKPSCLYCRGNKGYPLYAGFQPVGGPQGQQRGN